MVLESPRQCAAGEEGEAVAGRGGEELADGAGLCATREPIEEMSSTPFFPFLRLLLCM